AAGLAQPCREVHEPRRDDEAASVDRALGREVADGADGDDAAGGDGDVGDLVSAAGRTDNATLADEDLHRRSSPDSACGRRGTGSAGPLASPPRGAERDRDSPGDCPSPAKAKPL